MLALLDAHSEMVSLSSATEGTLLVRPEEMDRSDLSKLRHC